MNFENILEKIIGIVIFSIFIITLFLLSKLISKIFKVSFKKVIISIVAFFSFFFLISFILWGVSKVNNKELFEIGPVPEFKLTNQKNKTISNKDYLGKVYVVEFFFATCPTICPKMNQSMLQLQDEFYGNPSFGLVSITIDPSHDTPEFLNEHARLLGVKHYNWNFLTGDKDYIFNLANKGFNLYAGENNKAAGGFEHSGLFALVDKEGKIRCRKDAQGNPILYYDGLEADGVQAIKEDIKKLLEE